MTYAIKSLKLHMDCLFNHHIGVVERFLQTSLEINIFQKNNNNNNKAQN